MKLSPGDRIGAYRIEALIGSGGMGYVYGARHTHLDRAVAIKAMPENLALDKQALQRFRLEALAASSLSHPHICTTYDFVEDPRGLFLVMEYLDGETLSDHLTRGPLDHATLIPIALEIANGLAHAHGKGIIHRDLKPANVMLTPTGAKVLDFGMARDVVRTVIHAGQPVGVVEQSENTAALTVRGGTLPYMAPEQIFDGPVDSRADIYALGVTMYEMLTGRLPYNVTDRRALISAVMTRDPDPFAALPAGSSELTAVIRRCMAAKPDERWSSAAEVASALRALRVERRWPIEAPGKHLGLRQREVALAALLSAIVLVIGALALRNWLATPAEPPTQTFELQPPQGLTLVPALSDAALSPDGLTVLFSGGDSAGTVRLWQRSMSTRDASVLPNSERAHTPFWSPDSKRLGYFARDAIWITDLTGQQPQRLAPVSLESRGASWGTNQTIIYAPDSHQGLRRYSLVSGEVAQLTSPNRSAGEIGHMWPHFLPDGHRFIYFVAADQDSVQGIYAASLENTKGRRLTFATGSAVFSNGYLLFYRDTDVYAQAFNPANLALNGRAVPLLRDVSAITTHQAAFSVSNVGVLIYSAGNVKDISRFVSMDASGKQLAELSQPQRQANPSLSFDGARIAFELHQGTDSDIAILDLASGRVQRLTQQGTHATLPVWSPRDYRLAFVVEESAGWGLYIWHPDQSAAPRRVFLSPHAIIPAQWTATDEILFARRGDNGYDVFALKLAQSPVLEPLLTGEGHQLNPELSPGGGRLAYRSNSFGQFDVFVQDYPGGGNRCQISTVGGTEPRWSNVDSKLYFLQRSGELMLAQIPARGSCSPARPITLMHPRLGSTSTAPAHYVVQKRDATFIFNVPDPFEKVPVISAIVNWQSLLSRSTQ